MADGVRDWLDGIGLAEYHDAFVENAIDWTLLPHLTNEDLKDLGVAKLGDRKKLLLAVEKLAAATDNAHPTVTGPGDAPAAPSEAERRQLTVMFVDLVDSTAMSTKLDPEELREMMRRYQDAVAGAASRYAGYIAKYLGDGVLAYFGWPQAYEDQAERAVRAGLDAVAAVQDLKMDNGMPLRSRVGIATGQVVIGDLVGEAGRDLGAVTGETPNLAARLQEAAGADQVVVGAATRDLLGHAFVLEDMGPVALKGFADPRPAWRVAGVRDVADRFEAVRTGRLTAFIGREEEVGLLRRRWTQAKQGEGQVVLLSGDAGIGKSRLTRTLMERVADDPHTRLRYQCSPYHVNSALHPFIAQLERAAQFNSDDDAEARLNKLETLLRQAVEDVDDQLRLFAALLSLTPEVDMAERDPQRLKGRTFEAMMAQLSGLAAREPVFFLFEDAHWADPTSLELLQLMVDQVQDAPILAIVTGRPEFQPAWPGHAHITRLTLNRLDRRQGAAIVADLTGGRSLPSAVFDEIVAKTDGVPLFVEELTKTVLESDLLIEAGNRYELSGPLPPLAIPSTLQDSLMARLDRHAPVKEVAQIGAAIGREFGRQLLAAVAPHDGAQLAEALERLIETGVIFRRGAGQTARYIFKHAMIQDTAYASLLKSRRQTLHQRIAAAIEAMAPELVDTEPEILAHHLTEAGLAKRAAFYWGRASHRAFERAADAEALAHADKGLALLEGLPESDDRAQMEIEFRTVMGVVHIHLTGGTSEESETNYLRLRALCEQADDVRGLSEALWGLWYNRNHNGSFKSAETLSAELLELARKHDDGDMVLQAHHSGWTTALVQGDLQGALRHTRQGRKIYDVDRHGWHAVRFGGHDPGLCALSSQARTEWLLGFPDQALNTADDARRLAESVSHPFSRGHANGLISPIYVMAGRIDRAVEAAAAARAVADEFGYKRAPWHTFAILADAWAASERGDWRQAMNLARSAHQDTVRSNNRSYLLSLMSVFFLQGNQPEHGREAVDEALVLASNTGEHWWTPELHRLDGEILRLENKDDAAIEAAFQAALDLAREQASRSLELRAAMSLARHFQECGRRDDALELLKPIYGWFTEGFDTQDLIAAKMLIDELS